MSKKTKNAGELAGGVQSGPPHECPESSRRQFLASCALAGGGLILGCTFRPTRVLADGKSAGKKDVALNAWLRIAPDNSVTIMVSQAEMGQGIQTTLPAILADELGADWNQVKLENAPVDPAYRNPRIN